MGFYDCRCLATGVSLKGADAALVPLQPTDAGHSPIALAIKGNYNRLGSIDGIDQDANTGLILRYFLDQLRAGAFGVKQEYLRGHGCYPIRTTEHLLHAFERNINDDPHAAVLNGRPVVFALFSRAVWEAVARGATRSRQGLPALLRQVFRDSPAAEIYGKDLSAVSAHLRELSAVNGLLADRGIPWRPPEDPSQHYADEMRQFLEEARRAFRDSAPVTEGLDDYEREVADLLEDD